MSMVIYETYLVTSQELLCQPTTFETIVFSFQHCQVDNFKWSLILERKKQLRSINPSIVSLLYYLELYFLFILFFLDKLKVG